MLRNFCVVAVALLVVICSSCNEAEEKATDPIDMIIPKPLSVNKGDDVFKVGENTSILVDTASGAPMETGNYLSEKMRYATGFALAVTAGSQAEAGKILLQIDAKDTSLGNEGYVLNIAKGNVSVTAHAPAGLFYGIQTILQILPAGGELAPTVASATLPVSIIKDVPQYGYRGSMLDVARHFFSVDDVKRYIDLIAMYKMNVLHLHLADDQGWRIEIKSWPQLALHGGSSEVGGGKGGYYTQDQYKDIVDYAQKRYVTVIPEIDMPGHTNAALSSYAFLNCNDSATQLYSGVEVGFSTFCVKKDTIYALIDSVIRELAAITPGPYLHIGGDESHATSPEDYVTFENKVQPIVTKYGKKVIAWDEIATATVQPNTIAQYWADADNASKAVKQGAKLIMSPATKSYMDMQYDSTTRLGQHWAAYIEVDSAYMWDPAKLVAGIDKKDIVGIEAPLWTETINNMDDIEYMVFPRLPGYAEIGWSSPDNRNWDEYKVRLANQSQRFKALQIDYYPSKLVPWKL